MTLILGIESSCDETAAAVVEDGLTVRSNIIASQHDLHARYGGVVPEIASRAHLERITPVIEEALTAADVTLRDVDAIAVGNRPGLIGSLLVGVSAAKALAWALGKPLLGVDHVRAHLYAGLMRLPGEAAADVKAQAFDDIFPALGLVVSGGHSSLYALASPLELELLGRTIDDAVGEAYDKAAVILDAGYPGGPRLDKLAQTGDPAGCDLPRSLLGEDSLDFSYSGLKTALLYRVRGQPQGRGKQMRFERSAADLSDRARADIAAGFQESAIDTLMIKVGRAINQMTAQSRRPRSLLVGGGVSANSLLRQRVKELDNPPAGQSTGGLQVRVPAMPLCLDNAAMIAGLGFEHFKAGLFDDLTLPAVATTRV